MKLVLRLFVAFCVATVLAQLIIVTLAGIRGNLSGTTFTQIVALLNGIDISGERLQRLLDKNQETPVPTYEEVVERRAQNNLNLDMRERSIQLSIEQLQAMQAKLELDSTNFDNRKDAFYAKLDKLTEGLGSESLLEVQRTIESLDAEQAKDLLLKMYDAKQMSDVVAIVKGMQADKRKKILGEFAQPEELEKLYEILAALRQGEPTTSLIKEARNSLPLR